MYTKSIPFMLQHMFGINTFDDLTLPEIVQKRNT